MTLTKVSYSMINGAPANVLDFGAKGDGTTDDTAAIQAALDSGASEVYLPQGTYLVSDTLEPSDNLIVGAGREWGPQGSIIQAAVGMNKPLIKFTTRGGLSNLSLSGSATSLTTDQKLVYISGTNGVTLDTLFLNGGYTNLYIDGTSFYNSFNNCTFYTSYSNQFAVDSDTTAGVDFKMSNCRFLSLPDTADSAIYLNGLGSMLMTNVQLTAEDLRDGGIIVFFDNPAPNYGGSQITNCVFENAGPANSSCIYINGDVTPWTYIFFTNCNINGGEGPAITSLYNYGMQVNGGVLSSVDAGGSLFVPSFRNTYGVIFDSVSFQGSAGTSPIQCGASANVSGDFISCEWTGYAPFIDFSTANSVEYINVIGGSLGTATETVLLPNYKNTKKNVQVFNSNYGPIQYLVFTGTLSGSGTASITHGITSGNSRILSVNAFYKGGSAEAYPLGVTSIDGTSIVLGGSGAPSYNANYRCYVQYVQNTVAW